jgi:thymidylate synthase (FAD)
MKVTLLRVDGSDLDVVNAARASFAKHHDVFVPGRDDGLIGFLGRERHEIPFGHVGLSLHVKAPLFVARQMWKSHVGCVGGDAGTPAWSEVSLRYVTDEPEFHRPAAWRERAIDKKQGSAGALDEQRSRWASQAYSEALSAVAAAYDKLLTAGVAPEQARMILPASTMTQWRWTGSLLFFARVRRLRLASNAQAEAREVAAQIAAIAAEHFPVSWPALMETPNPEEKRV